ncbi:hypothetical protein K440DRAFT_629936 [Wilcoxina mikolae CBS 423.85]|nr:hypothetical protein K440DRAFT_629936 [Wilcoxina mikolae CBS 423.85]
MRSWPPAINATINTHLSQIQTHTYDPLRLAILDRALVMASHGMPFSNRPTRHLSLPPHLPPLHLPPPPRPSGPPPRAHKCAPSDPSRHPCQFALLHLNKPSGLGLETPEEVVQYAEMVLDTMRKRNEAAHTISGDSIMGVFERSAADDLRRKVVPQFFGVYRIYSDTRPRVLEGGF